MIILLHTNEELLDNGEASPPLVREQHGRSDECHLTLRDRQSSGVGILLLCDIPRHLA
eukprot:CAMPEP_0119143402 /NCGR_PEP_ID=MMETSP1310-20130426/34273_1 /TAXON_ID=464262 /ORGANISM="Genus nov. species nov., Strain RCC2339" /LENGTH=57 /DNA_ID=CAMNT_0007135029 /DNA_START=23 /DNA_END=192 /DNA_ORIENTATION=-